MKSPISRPARAKIRLAYLRELSRFENVLQKKIARLIAAQGKTIAEHYAAGQSASAHLLTEHKRDFIALLNTFYKRVGITFADKLGKSIRSSVFDQALQSWISSQSLSTVDDVDSTTLDIIKTIIANGVEQGLDVKAIAALIEEGTSTDNALARARVVARTEMHSAMNFAQVEAAKATGLTLVKTWTSSLDDRTREAHAEADGQTVAVDDDFIVDGESVSRPGEGSAENAINCRCCLIFARVTSADE